MMVVIATVTVKPGQRNEYLQLFKEKIPEVRKEQGCLEYVATIDLPSGLPFQASDENTVTIVEKWENMDDLKQHGRSKAMKDNWEKTKHLVIDQQFKILQPV